MSSETLGLGACIATSTLVYNYSSLNCSYYVLHPLFSCCAPCILPPSYSVIFCGSVKAVVYDAKQDRHTASMQVNNLSKVKGAQLIYQSKIASTDAPGKLRDGSWKRLRQEAWWGANSRQWVQRKLKKKRQRKRLIPGIHNDSAERLHQN